MPWGMRRLSFSLFILAVVLASIPVSAATIPSPRDLREAIPGWVAFERRQKPFEYYEMQNAQDQAMGLAFLTSSVPPEVGGYRGELDVLVGMDLSGKITGVKIIGHNESQEHIDRITGSGFLAKFIGKFAGDESFGIEAVTGATISSQAIIDDVKSSSKAVYDYIMSGKKPTASSGSLVDTTQLVKGLAALSIAALACICVARPGSRRLRRITLAASVAVVGIWLGTPVTIGNIVDLRFFGLPLRYNLPLAVLMLFALLAALVRRNLYCSYVCPFGALQEGAARVMPKKVCPSGGIERSFRWLRWIVTILALYAIAFEGSDAFRSIEPFSLLFMRYPNAVTLIQAGVALAAALFVRRVWCRFFCPTGLIIDIVAELGAKARHAFKAMRRRTHE